MRTHILRLFAVATVAIVGGGCGFRQEIRHPLIRSPILVELPDFHPVQMVVDLDAAGEPYGAMAMFGPGIDVQKLAAAIDERYARWRKPNLDYTWRIENQQFMVSLVQEGEWIRMFYIRFIDAKHPPTALRAPCACDPAGAPPDRKRSS